MYNENDDHYDNVIYIILEIQLDWGKQHGCQVWLG